MIPLVSKAISVDRNKVFLPVSMHALLGGETYCHLQFTNPVFQAMTLLLGFICIVKFSGAFIERPPITMSICESKGHLKESEAGTDRRNPAPVQQFLLQTKLYTC